MRSFLAAAFLAALLSPFAAAAEGAPRSFRRDGATYVYVTDVRADGSQVIRGRQIGGGSFRLIVADGRVRGNTAGRPVSFRVPRTAPQVPLLTASK